MPARQPFTALCQTAARPRLTGRADLHLHTHHSDGAYSPQQVVEVARRAGLAAIALTDHDTLAGFSTATVAAKGTGVEIIPGAEITSGHGGQEMHLLAYFVRDDDEALTSALGHIRERRVERYQEMVQRLRAVGVVLDDEDRPTGPAPDAVGRRHLAEWLVRAGRVSTMREAFARYLKDGLPAAVPKWRLPVAEAIGLVRTAGGVASWAHPPAAAPFEQFAELRRLGLGAIEVEFADVSRARSRQLRKFAAELDLAVSGGSDCHGPGPHEVGSCTISAEELLRLRNASGDSR
jgi:predicted metal-dependent phosphoesterase TrpH